MGKKGLGGGKNGAIHEAKKQYLTLLDQIKHLFIV
jgi:hypothetical protein